MGGSQWKHDKKAGHGSWSLAYQVKAGGMSPERSQASQDGIISQEVCVFCFLGNAKNQTVLKSGKLLIT